ncbi:MAG: acyl-CoA synthetase [Hyphomicrobiales bacterium]
MLPFSPDEASLRAAFRWDVPERYNIGVAVCDMWAAREPDRLALLDVDASGKAERISFADLRTRSNQLANLIIKSGVKRGERIAILLPQSREVAESHIAIYKAGAVALPLAVLFGVDALLYRLHDAGVTGLITNSASLQKLKSAKEPLPDFKFLLSVDGDEGDAKDFYKALSACSPEFTPVNTLADDPALMIYTSGTTGQPKGALHGHRVLPGHLPGFELVHEFFPRENDLLWTPADWAWAGGLLNGLLPSLAHGVPVVARKFEKFDADEAYRLMQNFKIRNIFVPPTALRMLRTVKNPCAKYDLHLRTIASAGEALGAETLLWAREELSLTINEAYGQTECNLVIGSCNALAMVKPGFIGKPVPGHRVAIIHEDGTECARGEVGQIAIARPDPVMFLGYWNRDEASHDKFIGDWMTTGDQGVMDDEGYIKFIGRDDDVITSSSYRIGPVEIEDCLIKHPAIALAAAIGKPDALRTEIVKAFVVLRPDFTPSDALKNDIAHFVKERLSAHEYPREIEFVESLPMTTTGKIIRRELRARG